ncbi:hypothetical protein MJH12_07560 [bacterium]|nr:hypothetical protein [bacterium]
MLDYYYDFSADTTVRDLNLKSSNFMLAFLSYTLFVYKCKTRADLYFIKSMLFFSIVSMMLSISIGILSVIPKRGRVRMMGKPSKLSLEIQCSKDSPFYFLSTSSVLVQDYFEYLLFVNYYRFIDSEPSFSIVQDKEEGIKLEDKYLAQSALNSIDHSILAAYQELQQKIEFKNTSIVAHIYNSKAFHKKEFIKVGDILLEMDGIKIKSQNQIYEFLKKKPPKHIKFKISRDQNELVINHHLNKSYKTIDQLGFDILDHIDFQMPKGIKIIHGHSLGNSWGLACALHIYFSQSKIKLKMNLKVAATGTIDQSGIVGAVGGLYLKFLSALKEKCDYIVLPKSMKKTYLKVEKRVDRKKYPHAMKVLFVDTLKEAIQILSPILSDPLKN